MSATHSRLCPAALNSRPTRSGRRFGPLGLRVVTGAPSLAFAGQSGRTHQSGSLLSADSDSFTAKRVPHLPHTINAIVISVNAAKVFEQSSVAKAAGTHATSFGLAVNRRGNEATFAIVLQRRANELDCETISKLINESDHFRRFG